MKQIILFFVSHGEKLSFKNDNIIITDADGVIKHQSSCYRLFALFVVGSTTITSGLIERSGKFGFSIVIMSQSLRITGVWSSKTEGNVILRKKQYVYEDLGIAKKIVSNKINSQVDTLKNIRDKNQIIKESIMSLVKYNESLSRDITTIQELLGVEGIASREYFKAVFSDCNWVGRRPRVKHDSINCLLDIGYTMLFNLVEATLNIYGFDLYYGVYHRQFYQRKSLVCDIVEPFRPIIDFRVRKAFNLGQIKEEDFIIDQGRYQLFGKSSKPYLKWLLEAILERREDIFDYVQNYYRAFMRDKPISDYPFFEIKQK